MEDGIEIWLFKEKINFAKNRKSRKKIKIEMLY